MDWHWYASLLILCISQRDYAEACDDDFKKSLLQDIENLLDTKLNPMNTQMNQINVKLSTFESKLLLLEGTVGDLDNSTEDLDGSFNKSQLVTDTVTNTQESYNGSVNAIKSVNNKVEFFEESVIEIKDLSRNYFEELNNIKSYMEENLSTVKNDISMILSDVKQVIVPINDMAGLILNIKDNTEFLKVSITQLKFLEHESNAILKGMKQGPPNSISTNSVEILEKIEEIDTSRMESHNVLFNSLLMLTARADRCPGGVYVSTQCFVILKDYPSNWTDAEKQCQSRGMILAEPSDTVVVPLRRFLLERYGDGSFWANAKGVLRDFLWQHSNKALGGDSPLWSPGQPGENVTPVYCLSLLAWEEDWKSSPGQPYHSQECSYIYNYPLCENILHGTDQLKSPKITLEDNISVKLSTMEKKIISSITMYNKSIDTLLQDTHIMKEASLAEEQKVSKKIVTLENTISTSLAIIHALEKNISTSMEIIDKLKNKDGFCLSTQCFLFYKDVKRNWADAKAKCEEEGVILAQPSDSNALLLRKRIVENFGQEASAESWVGGKGDGSKFVWSEGGRTALMADSSLLDTNQGNAGTGQCMELDAYSGALSGTPNAPYDSASCSNNYYTICEVIV